MNKTLQQSVKNLEEIFDIFNHEYYNDELVRPVISIQADKTGKAYGWCTTYKAWSTKDGEEYYEINMCAEHMTRSIYDICSTLLHEMAHLYNITHDINDCNAAQYHNKKFKETAESHGLIVEKTKHGWSKTKPNQFTLNMIARLNYSFDISRKADTKVRKTNPNSRPSLHYQCPCCGVKVYSGYELNITCNDCGVDFIQY